jgi:hypothetical protein
VTTCDRCGAELEPADPPAMWLDDRGKASCRKGGPHQVTLGGVADGAEAFLRSLG